MDDCLFLGSSHAQVQEMASAFDEFLATYGMSLNAKKCFYTSLDPTDPDALPPPLTIHHLDGSIRPVRYIPFNETFTYLGIDISLELNDWTKQLQKMHAKFAEANSKIYYSRANGDGAAKLLNQDAFTRLSYAFGPVSCPNSFRSKVQSAACKTVKHRGRLQSTVPYSCIMARARSSMGMASIIFMSLIDLKK
jgi:hypothetical protein